jgi:hypothetical protein
MRATPTPCAGAEGREDKAAGARPGCGEPFWLYIAPSDSDMMPMRPNFSPSAKHPGNDGLDISREGICRQMLDERLEHQKKKLEAAINKALTESAQINAAVGEIRDAGYDVFLIIEATIGFSKKEEVVFRDDASTRLPLTSQDERFLRSLKISPE